MTFSQRQGHVPLKKQIQVDDIDAHLRSQLWSVAYIQYFRNVDYGAYTEYSGLEGPLARFWQQFLKKPIDELPLRVDAAIETIKAVFINSKWYRVYDLVELLPSYFDDSAAQMYRVRCNEVLEEENSAYRFAHDKLVQITSDTELCAVEEAVLQTPLEPTRQHLASALKILSERGRRPEYRNSIKESISAVESMARLLAGPKATVSQALAKLADQRAIHPALQKGMVTLYGYTSDGDGIRHALLGQDASTFAEAKYMLVACSAFINYVVARYGELGLEISAEAGSKTA